MSAHDFGVANSAKEGRAEVPWGMSTTTSGGGVAHPACWVDGYADREPMEVLAGFQQRVLMEADKGS